MAKTHQDKPDKCYFFEIEQYFCEMEQNQHGVTPHCFPTPRLFKMCPDRPAVEITNIAKINMQTGEIGMPEGRDDLPEGKLWREVRTHKGG
ncbi:hypothetical protein BKA82DRAFT_4135673 [Pisolithus tinctorius]|nr:hypothetical protein BKA82DRAFT_4135673 [Pisolithus tinctorius]